jgi:catechol 2,3-dioxygenase-like lactoylglutathione lyase family enzyme
MQPASGEPVFLRIVEQPRTRGYAALRTHGWNANEILVEDPDAMAARLADSPFRIVGPPRPLSMNPNVKAMQAIGPADELIYLTRIPPGGSIFGLSSAKSFVDRTFIVVVGGPDMTALRSFYGDVLGLRTTEPSPAKISVLQNAYDLPADHEVLLGIASLPGGFLVELDEYPADAAPRPRRRNALPPGLAMVSFTAKDLDARPLPWVVAPAPRIGRPYEGRRAGVLHGAAGEWIEIVESTSR